MIHRAPIALYAYYGVEIKRALTEQIFISCLLRRFVQTLFLLNVTGQTGGPENEDEAPIPYATFHPGRKLPGGWIKSRSVCILNGQLN